jgi:hypothetical protein
MTKRTKKTKFQKIRKEIKNPSKKQSTLGQLEKPKGKEERF